MAALGGCVMTEVVLPPTLSLLDIHQRLHKNLPSSPYCQGAIYTPINEASEESSCLQGTITTSASGSPPSTILVLKGDFKWRFGGEIEHNVSPPWTWTSEQLCGAPFPYCARDFDCLALADRPKPKTCCAYLIHCSRLHV